MDVPAELTKEVGVGKIRLPIGLWIVAGAVGIFIARKAKTFNLGGSSSTSTSSPSSSADPLLATTLPSLSAGGAVQIVPGGGFNSGASSAITTNEQWRVAAQQYLTAQHYDALAAASAIAAFLANIDLTPAQGAMVEKALRYLGPTPEPVGPSHVLPGPTPAPKPTPSPKPAPAPPTNAGAYPHTIAANSGIPMTRVGTVSGGKYSGKNSPSGAPVYALVATGFGPNTSYTQGWTAAALPSGTGIYTLAQFAGSFR